MGQSSPHPLTCGTTHRSYPSVRQQPTTFKRLQYEGLLKLRPVPFKNCIQIPVTQTSSLFLENIEITLKDLLDSRMYTNKLFPKEDVERLVENATYTLAYLADNGIVYKDVTAENVFYDEGTFKLLPNDLIPCTKYQRFLSTRMQSKPTAYQQTSTSQQHPNDFITISPQMIIAYRCKQPTITQPDILDKSNVFCLGMLLLETCTLLPSFQCYDEESCDILDQVVSERVEMVKEYYSEEIAAIVANMLDYDYEERMGVKEMSGFVNRQLNKELISNSKMAKELSNKKQSSRNPISVPNANEAQHLSDPTIEEGQSAINHSQAKSISICKSRLQHMEEAESRISRAPHQQHPSQSQSNISVSQKKRNKTNKVYMNSASLQPDFQEESTSSMIAFQQNKEERNKVYMKPTQSRIQNQGQNQSQQLDSRRSPYLNTDQSTTQSQRPQPRELRQISNSSNVCVSNQGRQQVGKLLNNLGNGRQRLAPSIPQYSQKSNPYQANNEQDDEENRYPSGSDDYSFTRQTMKRKNSTDYLGYRPNNNTATNTRAPNNEKAFHHQPAQKQQQATRFQSNDFFDENQSFNNNNNGHNREDSDYSYPQRKQESSFGNSKFGSKESPVNEDSGSRGYFQASKPGQSRAMQNGNLNSSNQDFNNHDHSLNRIKSEIQRSRKLIEEFKRGQNVQFC